MKRVLEPEVMDTCDDAMAYDAMDHAQVNGKFVEDLLQISPLGTDILDLGTGTARIPVLLSKQLPEARIMATDASHWMLDIARYNLEVHQCTSQVQLHMADAKKLVFEKNYFDVVISNTLVHHLPEHDACFREIVRVLRPNGVLFIRDLIRPETLEEVESLVAQHGGESELDRQLLRQSLIASLTIDEIREIGAAVGIDPNCIRQTSNRHWTLAARLSDDKQTLAPV